MEAAGARAPDAVDTGAFNLPGVPRTVEVWVAGFLLTQPCAAASYYLLERPLLRLKYRRRKAARPGGLEAALPRQVTK